METDLSKLSDEELIKLHLEFESNEAKMNSMQMGLKIL